MDQLGPRARRGEPLWRHTSYRIGGPADFFLIAGANADLREAVSTAVEAGIPWRMIGSASNLLVADEGVEGLVVKPMTREIWFSPGIGPDGMLVHAEAGCLLAAVAQKATLAGLGGLEWAVSVPGTVGASVVNNSGAFGSSVAECLDHTTLFFPLEGGERTVPVVDLGYDYRTSRLKRREWIAAVVQATFRTRKGDAETLRARLADVEEKRRLTQPFGPSVGSVFRNPEGNYAGALIEQSNLKGVRVGDVEISPVHANFMLNLGHATARDVLGLIELAQRTVWHRQHVWLQTELEFIGRWSQADLDRIAGPPD